MVQFDQFTQLFSKQFVLKGGVQATPLNPASGSVTAHYEQKKKKKEANICFQQQDKIK